MRKFFGVLLIGCFLAGSAAAQTANNPKPSQNPSQNQEQPPQIHVQVNLENVLFTVVDKKNRLVTNLTRNDFHVYENGKPENILFFSRETNLPLRIGILIDTSNSIRLRLHFEQEAAIDFLYDALRPEKDEAFVVGFDTEPVMAVNYTDNLNTLSRGIRSLQAGGGTGLYDAIYYACKEKMIYIPTPHPYLRRVLILVSDGRDNFSEHSRDEALAMAQKAEVFSSRNGGDGSRVDAEGDLKGGGPSRKKQLVIFGAPAAAGGLAGGMGPGIAAGVGGLLAAYFIPKGKQAELPPGSLIGMRLDRDLTITLPPQNQKQQSTSAQALIKK